MPQTAFGFGWCLVALLILVTQQIDEIFGPVSGTNPLFILAVHSPAIAASHCCRRWPAPC
jgi:CAAX protease family protein